MWRQASQEDLRSAVEGLPQLLSGTFAARQPEDPLCGRTLVIQQSQRVLRGQRGRVAWLESGPGDGNPCGMGTPWPDLLPWMGWGSEPSWLQRAARGQSKRAPLEPEPDSPGAQSGQGEKSGT